ncbi:hypothetical protein BU17DRAFT_92414 [Hysterangium stoloniferum]|nr:hypothetical protein BU17DRAFT_92414 [Hysterangium stoloniferum]
MPRQNALQQDPVPDQDERMAPNEEEEQTQLKRSERTATSNSKTKVSKVKVEKTKKSRARRDASVNEEDMGYGEPLASFDKDEFLATARPIPLEGAETLSGVISDLQIVMDQVEASGYELVADTAVAVEEVSGNTEEGQEAGGKLDLVMRQLIDAQQELKSHQECLNRLRQGILRGEVLGDLEDVYNENVINTLEAYQSRTARQKYAKNKEYARYREQVWAANHEEAMPPLKDLISREDADSDSDSEIEVGGMTQSYKCPLTLRSMTDPLTSSVCGHSFSAEGIREYLKGCRGETKCPATGCNQVIKMAYLKRDEDLARRAAYAVRRAERRNESDQSDAEEVE